MQCPMISVAFDKYDKEPDGFNLNILILQPPVPEASLGSTDRNISRESQKEQIVAFRVGAELMIRLGIHACFLVLEGADSHRE